MNRALRLLDHALSLDDRRLWSEAAEAYAVASDAAEEAQNPQLARDIRRAMRRALVWRWAEERFGTEGVIVTSLTSMRGQKEPRSFRVSYTKPGPGYYPQFGDVIVRVDNRGRVSLVTYSGRGRR